MIDSYILRDIITDHNLCKKQKETLQSVIDKIEQGTLIDTKVKINQRVYRRGFFKGDIDEYIVSNIVLDDGRLEVHLKHDFDEHSTCYSVTVVGIEEIGQTVFLTREEAKNT